ncbi:monocarboxylate transporter 12-like [Branchiostoma floridae]|uniref:Monocarboxylate transporter 13 n=1 Tax=Branchiostoma floridae TaxID=7739 RepID=A0A9J7KV30_BRAFL|nr:monocarboxylate transporter 12-like [Branchiostoma floridae]
MLCLYIYTDMIEKKRTNAHPVDPPDGGWGWVVTVAGAMVTAGTFGISRSLGVFFVLWREQFTGVTAAEVALVQSMLMGMTHLSGPIASSLGGRFGFRPVIMAGGVLAAAGFCLSWFATHISHLYITVGCLVGFGGSLCLTNMTICVGRYFTKRRLLANSLMTLGGSLGAFAFPPLFQLLIDEYGTKGALLIAGGITFNITAFGALVRPIHLKGDAQNTTSKQPDLLDHGSKSSPVNEQGKRSCNVRKSFLSVLDLNLLREPAFALFIISTGFQASNRQASSIYLVPRAKFLGVEEYPAAFLMSILGIVGMVGRLLVGMLPEWKKFRRIDQYATAASLMGGMMMVMPLATSYGSMVAWSVVFGLMSGAYVPLTVTTAADLVDTNKLPSAMGLRMFVQGIATLVGPPVSGALRDVTGSYDGTFLLGGACVLVGGLIPFLLHMRVCTRQNSDVIDAADAVDLEEADNVEHRPSEVTLFITKETSL